MTKDLLDSYIVVYYPSVRALPCRCYQVASDFLRGMGCGTCSSCKLNVEFLSNLVTDRLKVQESSPSFVSTPLLILRCILSIYICAAMVDL